MIAMEKRVVHHPTPRIRPQEFGGGAKSAIRRLALGMADNRVKIRKKPGLDRGSGSTYYRAIRQLRLLPM